MQGSWIYYTPRPGYGGTDSFTYTVTDNRGSPVSGVVIVPLKPDDGPALNLEIINLDNGSYRLRFYGIPYRACRIEFSPATQPPIWQTLTSGAGDAYGVFEATDTPPGGIDTRFYRAVYQ